MSYSQQEADLIKENSRLRTELSDAKALMDPIKDKKIYQLMMDKQGLYIKLEQLKGDAAVALSLAERRLGIARSGLESIATDAFGDSKKYGDLAAKALDEMDGVK